jgi:hypothetical protein
MRRTQDCRTGSLRTAVHSMHQYEVRPRKDHRGVDLISDALPFGALWYAEPNVVERRRLSI